MAEPLKYSLADQVLINACAVICVSRFASDDAELHLCLQTITKVLPYVSRENRHIQKLAEASDGVVACTEPTKVGPSWSRAIYCLNTALASIFSARHLGALQAWQQTSEAKT